ncbi:MAG: alpha/beta hydrolase [Actinomycetota bacterium]
MGTSSEEQRVITADAVSAVQAGDLPPVGGFGTEQLTHDLLGGFGAVPPAVLVGEWFRLLRELGKVALGISDVEPAAGDRRFRDPAWTENAAARPVMQAYLAWAESLQRIADAEPDWNRRERLRFAFTALSDAMAPTNTLLGNPAAVKRAIETGGRSLVRGTLNWLDDLLHNGGMPSQVDKEPFELGGNVAASPGAVVFRNEMCELIQYMPTTERVHARPMLVIPPPVNKYYILDLAPGKSLIEHAVASGIQAFCISWYNPDPSEAHWGIDEYVNCALQAIDAVCEITGSEDLTTFATCAGGILTSILLGHMAASNDRRVKAAGFGVMMLDMSCPTLMGVFADERTVEATNQQVSRAGVISGRDMAGFFTWLRPNDLVWNYWVNNYLMGNDPPANDILFWNSDSTRLPARFHGQLMKLYLENPLVEPGRLTVLGTPIDLEKVDCDVFAMGGTTDHIAPWKACYEATRLFGGSSEFVLARAGHVQSLVSPPSYAKAGYFAGGDHQQTDADAWLASATEHKGSWWARWTDWLKARSGEERTASVKLGSRRHPPMDAAPGTYVLKP